MTAEQSAWSFIINSSTIGGVTSDGRIVRHLKNMDVRSCQERRDAEILSSLQDRQAGSHQPSHLYTGRRRFCSLSNVLSNSSTVPVKAHRQTPVIQKVQKTVEVPKIQFIDKFADAPVSVQAEGKKRKLPLPTESKTLFVNTASGDEEEDEGETHAPMHFSLCDGAELETRSMGEHEGATIRQVDDIMLEMKDVKSELLHVRELIGVLVRKERCAETRAEIAARRLDRLEREQDEQDDKERVVCRQRLRLWQSHHRRNCLHPC